MHDFDRVARDSALEGCSAQWNVPADWYRRGLVAADDVFDHFDVGDVGEGGYHRLHQLLTDDAHVQPVPHSSADCVQERQSVLCVLPLGDIDRGCHQSGRIAGESSKRK